MEFIGLGAALGLLVAAACAMCYRKGVRDGIKTQAGGSLPPVASRPGSPRSKAFWGGSSEGGKGAMKGEGEAEMMMRRYEAILSYDPYNQRAGMSEGERI